MSEVDFIRDDTYLHLSKIDISNFKNIKKGVITIPLHDANSDASITGIYGQNGSGKTTVISAISILKELLSGNKLDSDIYKQIHVEHETSELSFTFDVFNKAMESISTYIYSFKIGKRIDASSESAIIFDESLKASFSLTDKNQKQGKKVRLQDILKTTETVHIGPEAKARMLLGPSVMKSTDLVVEKELAKRETRSFLFSEWLLSKLESDDSENNNENEKQDQMIHLMRESFRRLKVYATRELFIVTTQHNGFLSFGILPLMMHYSKDQSLYSGMSPINLDGSFPVPKEIAELDNEVIESLNTVLGEIVPGLKLSMKTIETRLDENNKEVKIVELLSHKNEKEIPIKYESEGIKKLISILHLLICVYNQPGITVAVDEFDAGIFEYLLGEILKIIQIYGKGQLIFTSHNLRPLETLDKSSIVFSTTNPYDRFIRMQNVKADNNLRNMYYRDLIIKEQSEELYRSSNSSTIAFAFQKAGELL